MGAVGKQQAGRLWREELAEEAIRLYALGHGYRKVAEMLSSTQTVPVINGATGVMSMVPVPRKVSHMWVKRQVDAHLALVQGRTVDALERHRNADLTRISVIESTLAKRVSDGDLDAINVSLRLMDHRAKLLGLYAPVQLDATVRSIPSHLAGQVEQARLRNQQLRQQLEAASSPSGPGDDGEPVDAEVIDD